MARNNGITDQIKATQIQMARESQTLTERLNTSQEQLARVIANASESKVIREDPKVSRRAKGDARNTTAASTAVGQCQPGAKAGANPGPAASQKTATAIGMAMVNALMP